MTVPVRSYNARSTADELVRDFAAQAKDKVILTTGVSPAGLGAGFVKAVAEAEPALLILASRNLEKIQKTGEAITASHPHVKIRLLQLDLGSQAAVREAAGIVNSWDDVPQIDILMNNGGVMAVDYGLSPEGIENHFAINHIGHFLFTNLIMDKLLKSPTPRVVNVSSDGHRLNPIRWADYNFSKGETYNKWQGYGQSKTANILLSVSLAEKLGSKGLLSFSLHPGVIVETTLGTHLNWEIEGPALSAVDKSLGNAEGWTGFKYKNAEEGAATHVFAALAPLEAHNGAYLEDSQVADPMVQTVKPWATSKIEADKLWKLSETLVGQEFAY